MSLPAFLPPAFTGAAAAGTATGVVTRAAGAGVATGAVGTGF